MEHGAAAPGYAWSPNDGGGGFVGCSSPVQTPSSSALEDAGGGGGYDVSVAMDFGELEQEQPKWTSGSEEAMENGEYESDQEIAAGEEELNVIQGFLVESASPLSSSPDSDDRPCNKRSVLIFVEY